MEPKPIEIDIAKRDLIDGLIKGVEVIGAFNQDQPNLTPSDVAKVANISRSAARRYLLTLVHIGMAATDGKLFWLTPKVLNLGRSYLESARLPRSIVPFLQRLTQQLQESTNFAVLDGQEVVYVSRVNTPRLLTTGFEPGTRLTAFTSTAGRVLLAALPDEVLAATLESMELVPYTHLTITSKEELLKELQQVRNQGFAVTEGQFQIGLRGISVPVKNRHGLVVGALSVSMSSASCSKAEAVAKCVPMLQSTANTIMMWI
ncbi:IclR family transcriptional regulator domain-containing protein [Noviherbaspirillum denitrificans]|uniref:IclR family transcriptional regulator n=1 Tax=Noviherbaspirillum denitrificans TaxID=1968433 RepID=A0A254TQY5_9BURK|nr:IclR family transcriptional regulator C-terminal domain-containing protein [Noviherbaspirillum denitrificans]OWW22148.1 IclR family transcriptional regulator [Noviherbaspirillum denitrificans]